MNGSKRKRKRERERKKERSLSQYVHPGLPHLTQYVVVAISQTVRWMGYVRTVYGEQYSLSTSKIVPGLRFIGADFGLILVFLPGHIL